MSSLCLLGYDITSLSYWCQLFFRQHSGLTFKGQMSNSSVIWYHIPGDLSCTVAKAKKLTFTHAMTQTNYTH